MCTPRFTLALVAVLAALATLAACGGEDDGLGNRSLGGERASDTSSDDTSSSGAGGEFCSLYETYTEGANGILSGEASPDELRALYEEFDDIAGPLADAAPSEISDDVDTLVDVGSTMGDILEEHDYDVITDPALTEALNDDFIDASMNVDSYVSSTC